MSLDNSVDLPETGDQPHTDVAAAANSVTERIGSVSDFEPGTMKMAKVGDRRVLVACTASGLHAIDNACPHQGYGLTTGALDGDLVTCQWHNWKFDVTTGTCTRGEEDVASHPLHVDDDGEVFVTITTPSNEAQRETLWPSLDRGIEAQYNGQIARDVARLLDAEATPDQIVWRALANRSAHTEWGVGHEMAGAADALAISDIFDGLERTLPITHAVAGIAEVTRGRPARRVPEPAAGDFVEAVETERLDEAISALLQRHADGATPSELKGALIEAVSHHHLSYGHGLIYTQKACELLDRVGWHDAAALLPHLVTSIVWGTREDTLPYMSKAMKAIAEVDLEAMAATPDRRATGWAGTDELVETILEAQDAPTVIAAAVAAAHAGAGVEGVLDAVVLTVSRRMLRYDISNETNSAEDFRWLDISHGLIYARAARWAWREHPSAEAARLALFTAFLAFDTGRFERRTSVHTPDTATDPRVTDLADAILRRDPATAVALAEAGDIESIGEQLRRGAFTDTAGSFIVAAHIVKMSQASAEEAVEIGSKLPLMATARLAASARQERFVESAVTEAVEFIRTGAPPTR